MFGQRRRLRSSGREQMCKESGCKCYCHEPKTTPLWVVCFLIIAAFYALFGIYCYSIPYLN